MLQLAKIEAIKSGNPVSVKFEAPDTLVGDFTAVNLVNGTSIVSQLQIDKRLSTAVTGPLNAEFSNKGLLNSGSSSWTISNGSTKLFYTISVNIIGNITLGH